MDWARPIAGGTDLIPNMKHRLFSPDHVVALGGVEALKGIEAVGSEARSALRIGAGETLTSVSRDPRVREWVPARAEAAAHVAGPQLRNRGTLGGNLCLHIRFRYYNQTELWRRSLGYCLKKDGDTCHVTKVGAKGVAAHSADTPPVLMAAGAVVELAAPSGSRELPVEEFFGLLTAAVALWLDPDERIAGLRGVVTALGSRPRLLHGWDRMGVGEPLSEELVEALAERAHAQCQPLDNLTEGPEWRRAMDPPQVRRALRGLA